MKFRGTVFRTLLPASRNVLNSLKSSISSKFGESALEKNVVPSSSPLFSVRRSLTGYAKENEIKRLVVTAVGQDRPGIVARFTKKVLECGGNVEESRMIRLADQFSILMLVSVNAALLRNPEVLKSQLQEIEGLQVTSRWSCAVDFDNKPRKKFRKLLLTGADNPGLVYNVTEYLASSHINIEMLETSTEEAPFGGTTIFKMKGIVAMPISMSTYILKTNLETLQTSLGVDILISNLNPSQQMQDLQEWKSINASQGISKYSSVEPKLLDGLE